MRTIHGKVIDEKDNTKLADQLWNYVNQGKSVDTKNGEYKSWKNSIPALLEVLIDAGYKNSDIFFEYPALGVGRIDALLVGKDHNGKDCLVLIELKQWSNICNRSDKATSVEVGIWEENKNIIVDRLHPFEQVKSYKENLVRYNSAIIKNDNLEIYPLIFLHNSENPEQLISGEYSQWKNHPETQGLFGKNDKKLMIRYLKKIMSYDPNPSLVSALDNAHYQLNLPNITELKNVLTGKKNFDLIDDQRKIDYKVTDILKDMRDKKTYPRMIILSGGPGTGKTILGLNFLYRYTKIFNIKANDASENVNACFTLPRSRIIHNVIESEKFSHLSVPYLKDYDGFSKNLDLLIIDEAQRIEDVKKDLDFAFQHSRMVILLQDDKQRILPCDNGTKSNFIDYARKILHEVPLVETLNSPKRNMLQGAFSSCVSSMLYKNKPKKVNNNRIQIYSTAQKLYRMIENDACNHENNRNKLIAPIDWDKNSKIVFSTKDGIFRKKWNPTSNNQAEWYWAKGKTSYLDRVGCIYTVQGLEFDTIGFIWGKDFTWNPISNNWQVNINYIKDESLFEELLKSTQDTQEEIMKNIYYVLLTRAVRKLGIYFMDKNTQNYVSEYLGISEVE